MRNTYWLRITESGKLLATMLGSPSHIFLARLTRLFSHGAELRIGRKLRNWFGQILIESVGTLLPNLTVMIAKTII